MAFEREKEDIIDTSGPGTLGLDAEHAVCFITAVLIHTLGVAGDTTFGA